MVLSLLLQVKNFIHFAFFGTFQIKVQEVKMESAFNNLHTINFLEKIKFHPSIEIPNIFNYCGLRWQSRDHIK